MNKWHSLSFCYHITICQTSLLSSLIWVVLLRQAIFYDVSHSFFSSYSREKFLKILDIFCRQTMLNRYPLLSGREYLELSLPMHANLGLIHVILILNI